MSSSLVIYGGIAVLTVLSLYTFRASRRGTPDGVEAQTKKTQKTKSKVVIREQEKNATGVYQNKPLNLMAAKQAFINNIALFAPRLNSLCDGSYCSSDWTDDIIDINNEDLMLLWKRIHTDSNSVLRVLSTWGLKPDMCKSFISVEYHLGLYTLSDGSPIVIGKDYKVDKQCWLFTENDSEGNSVKRIIVKGVVS